MTGDGKTGPSRWYYGLAVAIGAVGIVAFVLLVLGAVRSMASGMTRVAVPGKHELTLDEPGRYMIYHEYRSVLGNEVYNRPEALDGLKLQLVSRRTGQEVALSPPGVSATYTIGGRSGVSLMAFRIDEPGLYALKAEPSQAQGTMKAVLAIGRDQISRFLGYVFGSLAVAFISLGSAASIALVTFFKRRKAANSVK